MEQAWNSLILWLADTIPLKSAETMESVETFERKIADIQISLLHQLTAIIVLHDETSLEDFHFQLPRKSKWDMELGTSKFNFGKKIQN